MIKKLKQLRLDLDSLYHFVHSLNPAEESRPAYTSSGLEYSIKNPSIDINSMPLYECEKSILLAKAWAGSFLGHYKEENPYKNNGKRKTVEDIEPTDSVNKAAFAELNGGEEPTYIQKVDWIREKIKEIYTNIGDDDDFHGEVYGEQIYIKLTEARYHLGFALQAIKDGSES